MRKLSAQWRRFRNSRISKKVTSLFERSSADEDTNGLRGDCEITRAVLLAELEFTGSIIRTYRESQMQVVGFSLALFAALLGLVGAAMQANDATKPLFVASYGTALLPFPTALLVLAFAVMEIRIQRASLFNQKSISPRIEKLRKSAGDTPLLQWEASPGRWLSPFERAMSHSTLFVLAMTMPALLGSIWHLWSGMLAATQQRFALVWSGASLLVLSGILAASLSAKHESRKPER